MAISNGSTILASDITGLVTTQTGSSVVVTTAAGERLIVIAKTRISSSGGTNPTISLRYNGVTKDSHDTASGGGFSGHNIALMYTEVPGAQTSRTIDVVTSAGSLSDTKIIVVKVSTG